VDPKAKGKGPLPRCRKKGKQNGSNRKRLTEKGEESNAPSEGERRKPASETLVSAVGYNSDHVTRCQRTAGGGIGGDRVTGTRIVPEAVTGQSEKKRSPSDKRNARESHMLVVTGEDGG